MLVESRSLRPVSLDTPPIHHHREEHPSLAGFLQTENAADGLYQRALDHLGDQDRRDADVRNLLTQIQSQHAEHARTLRCRIEVEGDCQKPSSNAGDQWAKAILGTANRYSTVTMLRVLKENEEQALADYRRGVDELGREECNLLWGRLIPATERNVDLLEEMLHDRSP